jgi:carboxyl-terminal processing protease
VIGETSFGKGTVQTVIDLDRIAKNVKPKFGELKMTIAQFFRINGGTTQLRGVIPDISFPTLTDTEDFGETSYTNALPWSQIKPAEYSAATEVKGLVPKLMSSHEKRMKSDKDFRYLREDIARVNEQRKKNYISLNEDERRKERDAQEARIKLREQSSNAGLGRASADNKAVEAKTAAYEDDGLQANERNLATELANEKARKSAKDIYLDEAVHILSDEVGLLKVDARLAKEVQPVRGIN